MRSATLVFMGGLAAGSTLLWMVPVHAQTSTNAFGGLSESSGEPIDIVSDTLTMLADDYALFTGNVKAVQGTTTLRARELKVHYLGGDLSEGTEAPSAGPASAPKEEGGGTANSAKTAASEPGSDDPASQDAQRTIDDPIDINSDWLLVHDKENYAHFKGNVSVLRGDTRLRSKELIVNFAEGESLSAAAETSNSGRPAAKITKIVAEGDVRALLTPKESTETQTSAAAAQTKPGNDPSTSTSEKTGQTGAGDRAPGNQSQGTSLAETTDSGAQGNEPAANRQITKLEAAGDVVITSENDETSTSDWAVYDLPSELVTIGGNVVLTQNETVLKGDRLVVDLKTGESRFENTGTAATGGRRIRALFMPKDGGGKPSAKRKSQADSARDTPAGPEAYEDPLADDTEPLPLVPEFR